MPPERTASSSNPAKKARTTNDPLNKEEATKAWEWNGSKALINGDHYSGFDSKIFTLIVGPEEKQFTAHASFLAQSPVFDRMCHGHFEESHTLQIRLPEDDPIVIKAIIQYLYSGSFHDFGTEEACGNTADAANELAEIYIVAEKYGLEDLKTLILEKLDEVTDVTWNIAEFLSVSRKIYACTSDSDDRYSKFFEVAMAEMPSLLDIVRYHLEVFQECVSSGGKLAVDMVTAILYRHSREFDELQKQLSTTKRKLKRYKDLDPESWSMGSVYKPSQQLHFLFP
ncbi:MAG: hypothetical protein Q9200_006000 [Gallowayella weberi]